MKSITIFQENIEPIKLYDDDDSPLQEYSKNVSSIFEVSNATVLETTDGSIILRPHKLVSVLVIEEPSVSLPVEEKISEEEEDIITDAE